VCGRHSFCIAATWQKRHTKVEGKTTTKSGRKKDNTVALFTERGGGWWALGVGCLVTRPHANTHTHTHSQKEQLE